MSYSPERPKRRVRYSGKNPRGFAEKYKEHDPARYGDDVAKVLASGKTPAGMHVPIMVAEILEVLQITPGAVVVDCTLGYGGHARELLAATQPGGRLIGVDQDPIELPKTEARLRALGFPEDALTVARMNFAGIARLVGDGADALLADLGVSSMQIDDPARGFTFKTPGPLDLRMNPARGMSAAALLGKLTAAELVEILATNSDEPQAAALAAAILRQPLATTTALADVVRRTYALLPHRVAAQAEDAVRRVFQALRIEVNDEFGALDTLLRNLPACLKPGGRVAILTFHSGEDRRVKQAFKAGLQSGIYSAIADEVRRAAPAELRANPRASSAKLRWAVRSAEI